jgi:hypothetical protein
VDVNYTGTVTFTTSDPDPGVVQPPDYTFSSGDAGVVTFSGAGTLVTLGSQDLVITDTLSGMSGMVTIIVTTM